MLTKESLNSAMPLAERLDNNGLLLTVEPGTPLEALVKATRSDDNFNNEIDGVIQPDVVNIEYIANAKDPVLGISQHDTVMDEVVELASKAVQGHIMHARTVVAPAVMELAEKTMTVINAMTASSLLGMEVIIHTPPKPLENATFEKSVRRFEEVAFDMPNLMMRLPAQTAPEIIALMNTGSAGVDTDIAEWAATKGESFFINIWENVFQIKQAGLNEVSSKTFADWIEDREVGLDNALAIHLLARRLTDDPLPETEMNLNAFNTLIVQFRDQSGARLVRGIELMNRDLDNGILVRSTNDRTTVVNSSVYRKFIELGGSNEVLFGNLLDLPAAVTLDAMLAKAEALKAGWNKYSALTMTVESNNRFNRIKEVMLSVFIDQIKHIEDPVEASEVNQDLVVKQFQDLLVDVRADEINNIYNLSLKLVCRSRFFRTDAERILSGIERITKENPNIDVREAAAIAMIEYVAYWVSTQIKVSAL